MQAGCSFGDGVGSKVAGNAVWQANANAVCKLPLRRLSTIQQAVNTPQHTAGALAIVLPKLRAIHPPASKTDTWQSFLAALAGERCGRQPAAVRAGPAAREPARPQPRAPPLPAAGGRAAGAGLTGPQASSSPSSSRRSGGKSGFGRASPLNQRTSLASSGAATNAAPSAARASYQSVT